MKNYILSKAIIVSILASVTIMLSKGIVIPKIQITEGVFLVSFIIVAFSFILIKQKTLYLSDFIKPIIIYLIIAFASIFHTINPQITIIEFIGLLYLSLLFLLWINVVDTKQLFYFSISCWIGISIIISLLGIFGIVLAYCFNINNIFVTFFEKHPYINNLFRVHSTFFTNEKFFSSYLLISIPIILARVFVEKNRRKLILFCLLLLSFFINLFFTYSRSIVGILAAVYIMFFMNNIFKMRSITRHVRTLSLFLVILVGISVFLVSHFQLIEFNSRAESDLLSPGDAINQYYYHPDIGVTSAKFNIKYIHTFYFQLKRYALKMFSEHPFFGVGNGAFLDQIKIYQRMQFIPKNYLLFDPHSMFFGNLAQLGIIGFLALIYLWLKIILTLRNNIKKNLNFNYDSQLKLAFYAAIIGFFIQGVDLDIMNFRLLWLLFAFAAISLRLQQIKETN